MRSIAREMAEVIDTECFRSWYERSRCEAAPPFHQFLAYVRSSMGYDVPGREICSVVWEATHQAFGSFDAARGDQKRSAENRFLTHWRSKFGDLAKKNHRQPKWFELPSELVDQGHDRLREYRAQCVREAVDLLTPEDALLIRMHFWQDEPLASIAKQFRRRKELVIKRHRAILDKLRYQLSPEVIL
jgi:hypothetical protein